MPVRARENDDIARVLDATDIVRVVGEHVRLKARGREYVGLCPFHDDHTPSMCVVPSKQIFKCFVCGAGGDALGFLQRHRQMAFREALEHLAERARITLTPWSSRGTPVEPDAVVDRAALARANALAGEFFRAILRHPEHGEAARGVIARRNISPEMVEQFGLGASPARWDGLLTTLTKKGLSTAPYTAAGLLKTRESDGSHYDSFRNRLMFPIHDSIGRVIAFGARKIDQADEPKYLNSSDSPLFEKSGTLYGLFQASRAIQTERTAVVVEGYTDVIACHQAGLRHVVATLGTALTPRHAAVLRRLCDKVVLLFDGDEAGQRASDRAVEVFFAESVDVKIGVLSGATDAKDPDELLKRPEGPEAGAAVLRRVFEGARDLLEYRFDRLRDRLRGAGLSAVEQAVRGEVSRLVELGLSRVDPLRRQLIIKRLTGLTGLPDSVIAAAVPAGRDGRRAAPVTEARPIATLSAAEHALGCLLVVPGLWHSLGAEDRQAIRDASLDKPATLSVCDAVEATASEEGEPSFRAVLARLEDPDAQAAAVHLSEQVERATEGKQDRVLADWRGSLSRLAHDRDRRLSRSTEIARSASLAQGMVAAERARRALRGNDPRVVPRPG